MSKIIVIYDSKTGFTEAMAKIIIEGVTSVSGVSAESYKVGSPFSISNINQADAIILGSPTRYGSVTQEIRAFLDSLKDLIESKRITVLGKIGGVFGSYEWDGGWVVEKITAELEKLGIGVVAAVSLADGLSGRQRTGFDETYRKQCFNLGKTVAEKIL
jgi:NAD(P)H dehydrogenase (quinone)